MSHLALGIWIWIGGMPIVGMIVLRWMRREPKPEDALGPRTYRRMKRTYEMDDVERNLIAILMAIFWPGVIVLLILLLIVSIILIEEAWRRYKAGERPEDFDKKNPPDA